MKTMDKPFTFECSVFTSCALFWMFVYCSLILLLEIITLNIYIGVILLLVIIITYVCLWYFALPQPDDALVTEILGNNPRMMIRSSSLTSLIGAMSNSISKEEQDRPDDCEFFPVIGHRGAGLDAPENSLSAIKQCHEKGCRAVEFDLALTADDVPVLFHDDTVDRLTNATGLVQQMTWEQLQTLDISVKHPLQERFEGERVALFSEVIQLCLDLDMRIIIDVKDESVKVVQVILETFQAHPKLYKRAMVSAFNPFIIYMVRARDPKIVCSLAWRPYFYSCSSFGRDVGRVRRYTYLPAHVAARVADLVSTWLFNSISFYILGLSAVLLHKDVITSDVVTKWEERNIRVVVWTVNRPHEKLYFRRVLQLAYITDTLASDKLGTLY
ncbi:glycerophosphodiester phosphodiesterase 1 [Homalodisca vitripennis]|uniref:glycerophosphodiester phosphodiesterase 1 n=1 Tax=Homalodisca vitripennis TaxID=197043 RepID=UPI001EEC5C15|nr:glycerophosphodiester phosphodiesterase 1 [Homalodisca vitripennis]